MNYLKLYTVLFLSITISGLGFAQNSIDPLITKLTKKLAVARIPGAMISIVQADSILYAGGIGYADLEEKTPVSTDHLFRQGSISKSFTALGLVKLLEEKGLSLSTPISQIDKYLQFKNDWQSSAPITVEQVLEHTAGFDEIHFLNKKEISADHTCKMLVEDNIKSLYARWKPGTRMAYSNAGFFVAGQLIESLSNQRYNDYLSKEILSPIGMETAGFYYEVPAKLPLVNGYYNEGGKFHLVPFSESHASAAGDLCANAKDMANYLQFMLNRKSNFNDAFIIPNSTFDRIETAKTTLAAKAGFTRGYGLGNSNRWMNGHLFHGHDGMIAGFSSIYLYSKTANIGIAIAINSHGDLYSLFDEILDHFVISPKASSNKKIKPITQDIKDRYEGFYDFYSPRNQLLSFLESTTNGVSLEFKGDSLLVRDYMGTIQDTLFHQGNNIYFRQGQGIPFVLLLENEAGETALWLGSEYAEKGSKWLRTTQNVGMVASLGWTILFIFIGFIGLIRQFFNKSAKSKRSRLLLWLAALSFILMPLGIVLSGEVLDSPTSFNAGTILTFISSISFFLFSFFALVQSFKLVDESLSFKIYYRFTAFCLSFLAILLLVNNLIGFRLWMY